MLLSTQKIQQKRQKRKKIKERVSSIASLPAAIFLFFLYFFMLHSLLLAIFFLSPVIYAPFPAAYAAMCK